MLTVCSVASGSNGNCYYIGNEKEAILVDAGISAKRTLSRLSEKGLDPSVVKAILITHEHSDHTIGARVLSKKLNIPVWVTSKTYKAMYGQCRPMAPRFFNPGDPFMIGSFVIYPFGKRHDAAQPCSFRVEYDGISTGVFTDIGSVCDNVKDQLARCHILFLETNYDHNMLWKGRYSWPLKKRIASEYGHLSNDQAFELISGNPCNHLQTVFLSHLSAENNTPDIAMQTFQALSNRFDIRMTSRYDACDAVRF